MKISKNMTGFSSLGAVLYSDCCMMLYLGRTEILNAASKVPAEAYKEVLVCHSKAFHHNPLALLAAET